MKSDRMLLNAMKEIVNFFLQLTVLPTDTLQYKPRLVCEYARVHARCMRAHV